ncbi:hypothetical protein [Micromonospora sp. NPDC047527]|uniref:hypothetical protein n=1 Tax=Micromonospora sp. NPDC047527 TaxID=3155144 RepID=UPI0033E5F6E8
MIVSLLLSHTVVVSVSVSDVVVVARRLSTGLGVELAVGDIQLVDFDDWVDGHLGSFRLRHKTSVTGGAIASV